MNGLQVLLHMHSHELTEAQETPIAALAFGGKA